MLENFCRTSKEKVISATKEACRAKFPPGSPECFFWSSPEFMEALFFLLIYLFMFYLTLKLDILLVHLTQMSSNSSLSQTLAISKAPPTNGNFAFLLLGVMSGVKHC